MGLGTVCAVRVGTGEVRHLPHFLGREKVGYSLWPSVSPHYQGPDSWGGPSGKASPVTQPEGLGMGGAGGQQRTGTENFRKWPERQLLPSPQIPLKPLLKGTSVL